MRDYQIPPTLWPAIDYAPMPGLPLVSIPEMECCLGLESDPWAFVGHIVQVYREVWRVLRNDGVIWVNFGDSYATGQGKVGNCPGGGFQGEDFKRKFGIRTPGSSPAMHGFTQPNRMPIHGLKPKNLIGIPWRVAFALQSDGWYLRSDIIWEKPSCMPESVKDRCTRSHEYIFMMSKSERYYFDADAIKETASLDSHARYARERSADHKWSDGGAGDQTIAKSFSHMLRKPGVTPKSATAGSGIKANESFHAAIGDVVDARNKRTVWTVNTVGLSEAHFATFPPKLIEPCILAGSRPGDVVLDPFMGARTTAITAHNLGRDFTGCEISPEYNRIGAERYKLECCQRNAFAELARNKH